ncbi:MAG TPA: polyprenyl diphosphate synthase [Thermotogota bacterium]|nr:polyprenyl diphosphate synthase [Thermotogota bacterium]HRW33923.1 polyprenyl diphosphate synthase [Thermotogota bacterium]
MSSGLKQENVLRIPKHLAFIMDGNGRWAKNKGLDRSEGHAAGAEVAEQMVRNCHEMGIKYCTLYAFSTENWKRPSEEVAFLFQTLIYYLEKKSPEMIEKGVRIRFSGHIEALPQEAYACAMDIENRSGHCERFHMIIALNYGGRQEIWDAALRLYQALEKGECRLDTLEQDQPERFRHYLYLPDVPDPDLLIRTGGEMRISNFLLWQLAYTELIFTDILWPDLNQEVLIKLLEDYSKRERRFGGL